MGIKNRTNIFQIVNNIEIDGFSKIDDIKTWLSK